MSTLARGSAKVPHLPYLEDVILARDELEAQRALFANTCRFEEFAATLDRFGYESMAATVRGALAAARRNLHIIDGLRACPTGVRTDRLNSPLRSLLEWTYAASLKTAGASTMEFAPWRVGSAGAETLEALGRDSRGRPHVVVSHAAYDRIAAANAVIYERGVGLINEAHAALPAATGAQPVIDRAAESMVSGRSPRFEDPSDRKTVLKVDYKLAADGRLFMVDLNAGTIGAHFDDLLLRAVWPDFSGEVRIVDHQIAAILEAYGAARGGLPARAVVTVLDERMYDMWYEADLVGLVTRLNEAMAAAGRTPSPIAVISLAELYAYAADLDDSPERRYVLNGVTWPGRPDVVVAYSWGTTHADRNAYERLNRAGIFTLDGAQHSLLAAKEFALEALAPPSVLPTVAFPATVRLGSIGEIIASGDVCAEAWRVAEKRKWPAVAVKMQKLRRVQGRGDFPSAYIYPVTPVGRLVAGRLASVFREIESAGGGELLVTASCVELGGGVDDADGLRRDVELRSYAFPVA